MRIDKNTTIRLGNRNIVKIKKGDVVIWQKSTEPVVGPDYFYIESLGDGDSVKLITELRNTSYSSYLTPTIEYSTDKQNWTTITFDWSTTGIKNINIPVVLNTGDKMYFRNDTGKFSRTIFSSSSHDTSYITFTTDWNGRVNVGGDIRTLINYRNIDNTILEDGMFSNLFSHTYGGTTTAKIVDASNLKLPFTEMKLYCYYQMFDGCGYLTSTPTLPATTLAGYCYYEMFYGCSSLTTLPELPATILSERCYYGMFRGCTSLTSAPTLPVTTLADYCYSSMFSGCSKLTTAPELPLTTLKYGCYDGMFRGCTSLTSAPTLPATTLKYGCYAGMFRDCTSLTSAPTLPATTLEYDCYYGMFRGCTSLTSAPTLPATTLATECYKYMFSGTSLTTAPTLPATTLADYCYQNMFDGCTKLTTAPALPATKLAGNCYESMFNGCSNLNKVLTYADDISASNCTTNWLNNVSSSGTLYNAGSAVYTTDSPSGIPTGWTEVKTVPTTTSVYALPDTFSAKSWMDKSKLNYIIIGVNETGIDVPLIEHNELITIGKNTGSSTVTHTETLTYDGMNYTITINQTANDTDEPDYFYIESLGDGNTVSVKNQGDGSTDNVTPTLEYSTDKNTWNTITFDWTYGNHTTELPVKLNTGGKMYFRNDTRLFSNSSNKYISFSSSVSSNVGGDIRTLSNYLNVDNETTVQSNMFRNLFYNNKNIVDASNLRLPYTTLADYCYIRMFQGCTSLTAAPTLPATTLAAGCYQNMFSSCNSLTTAPALPATTLAAGCYAIMFSSCNSLTTAPTLPATTLANECCYNMFAYCSKLNNITVYADDISAFNCTNNWLYGVASSGTFNNYGSATYTVDSPSGIPSGWTEVKN